MMTEHSLVSPKNKDFLHLVGELNKTLLSITNDSGESSFSYETFCDKTERCIVLYKEGRPVACACIRYLSEEKCELKRMYSNYKGSGSEILMIAESLAREIGYNFIVLSTRIVNKKAIDFYSRNGYSEIARYGKYSKGNQSICMGKSLIE
ncbi:GNAT family N-acetyltransferase [Vibrio vulnificus]